jgi:hypothetical protein
MELIAIVVLLIIVFAIDRQNSRLIKQNESLIRRNHSLNLRIKNAESSCNSLNCRLEIINGLLIDQNEIINEFISCNKNGERK